jgi:hypothetical protein
VTLDKDAKPEEEVDEFMSGGRPTVAFCHVRRCFALFYRYRSPLPLVFQTAHPSVRLASRAAASANCPFARFDSADHAEKATKASRWIAGYLLSGRHP